MTTTKTTTVYIDSDASTLGPDATQEDLDLYTENLAAHLAKRFSCSIEVEQRLGGGPLHNACPSNDEIAEYVAEMHAGDGWVELLGESVSETTITLKLFTPDGRALTAIESLDPTIALPTEIQIRADGTVVACHADNGDTEYTDLEALVEAYQIGSEDALAAVLQSAQIEAAAIETASVYLDEFGAAEARAFTASDRSGWLDTAYEMDARGKDWADGSYRAYEAAFERELAALLRAHHDRAVAALHTIQAAHEAATGEWDGMHWDSSLAPVGGLLRRGKRVDAEEIGTWFANDGSFESQKHRGEVHALKSRIEDMIDEGCDDETREEIASLADELAAAEAKYVEMRAAQAEEEAQAALDAAENGDLDEALRRAKSAASTEHEFGDDPTWGPFVAAIEAAIAAIED